jgi:transcription elongation factor GreA
MTMTDQDSIWLTQEAFDKLTAELADLKGPIRQKVVEQISAARDEGDLKENGGYHAAREEQGKIEGRIKQLEQMLLKAEVGPADGASSNGLVQPGMVVTYKFVGDDDDEAEKFLLGAREIDPAGLNVVSPQSPLGGAVIGARKGDAVSYLAPNGKSLEVVVLDAVPYTG